MQNSLKIITLSGVFAIEQLNETLGERSVQILRHLFRSDVGAHYEFEKELVYQLKVRPRLFEVRFVLVGVDCGSFLIFKDLRIAQSLRLVRKRSEEVYANHLKRIS